MKETINTIDYRMIGHNIRLWRIGTGTNRSAFAKQFNITVEDLINYEYAFEPVPTALVALICESWGMKLSDLTKQYFNDYPKVEELEDDFEIDFTNRKMAEKKELASVTEKLNEAVNKCKYVQKLLNATTEENFSLKSDLNEKQRKIEDLENQLADKGPRIFLASPLSKGANTDDDPF